MSSDDTYEVLNDFSQYQRTILSSFDMYLSDTGERELLRLIKIGSRHKSQAFTEIYRRHHLYIWKYIRCKVTDEQEAKDVFSEVWEVAIKKIHTVEWQDLSLKYWLRAIAYNKRLEHHRAKVNRNNTQLNEELHARAIGYLDNLLENLEVLVSVKTNSPVRDCADQLLHKAIQQLSARDKQIVLLRYFQGLNSSQIAERLHMKPSAIRKAHQRVLPKLKKQLELLEEVQSE